jgi:squalene cyclase
VFRLLGLRAVGATKEEIRTAVNELLATQLDDGGWAQTDRMTSDAYATGQAILALKMGGGVPVTHPAFNRGYKYLLKTQKEDGSWYVEARTIPLQVFIHTDFPHGKNQFISLSATCWATMALSLTVETKMGKTTASR